MLKINKGVKMSKVLQVIEFSSGKVVKVIDVTGKSENSIEKIERGLLYQMDREKFYVSEEDIENA
jgi:hypothetical protein